MPSSYLVDRAGKLRYIHVAFAPVTQNCCTALLPPSSLNRPSLPEPYSPAFETETSCVQTAMHRRSLPCSRSLSRGGERGGGFLRGSGQCCHYRDVEGSAGPGLVRGLRHLWVDVDGRTGGDLL